MLLSTLDFFGSADAKSDVYFSTGFRLLDIVALYLFAARLPRPVNAAILLVLSVLVFVRIGYVYPTRTPTLRGVTTALGAVWTALVVAIVWKLPDVPPALLMASLFFPIYYVVLSLVLHARRARVPSRL